MKHYTTALGGAALAMALGIAGCSGGGSNEFIIPATPTATPKPTPTPSARPTPTATPTPVTTADFVTFVHQLFAKTSDTTQPEDINDLNFSNLNASPDAFDDLLK